MELLKPDSSQSRPTFNEAQAMCQEISLELRPLSDSRLESVLHRLRETHANGGALFASFNVGSSEIFDWFASRSQLPVFGILRQILARPEVIIALPDLQVQPISPDDPALVTHKLKDLAPADVNLADYNLADYGIGLDSEVGNTNYDGEFQLINSFLFDGELAGKLYAGGAYTRPEGNGRAEKENSLAFCDALFGLRFAEVSLYSTDTSWTPWFAGIAWDWTALLFDRLTRTLSVLALTDSD
jgi:hypothetical protein